MELVDDKDKQLWKTAKKRAGFKRHLYTYLVINAFFWIMWLWQHDWNDESLGFPWPLWVTLGWGIGLAFNYWEAYRGDKDSLTMKEYERLTREKENK